MAELYYPTVRTKVGKRQLICTNVVHLGGVELFEICLDSWSCNVMFVADSGVSRYQTDVDADGKLVVRLYNHNNPLGESIFDPITLARAGDTVISMTYWTQVITPGSSVRRLEYTIWVEAANDSQ